MFKKYTELLAYYGATKNIENIEFTHREIDVISCILNGRTAAKEIAMLLGISPKVVETYKANINLKLRYINQNIRNFMERSRKFHVVKEHYLHLSNEFYFHFFLKKTAKILKSVKSSKPIVLIYVKDNDSSFFIGNSKQLGVKDYLRVAGFDVRLSEIKNITYELTDCIKIFVVTDKLCDYLNLNKDKLPNFSENFLNNEDTVNLLNLFVSEIEVETSTLKTLKITTGIVFTENYYTCFYNLLSNILKNPKELEDLYSEFLKNYNEKVPINISNDHIKSIKENVYIEYEVFKNRQNFSIFETAQEPQEGTIKLANESNKISTWTFFEKNRYYFILTFVLVIMITISAYLYFKRAKEEPWNTPYLPEHFVNRTSLRDKIINKLKHDNHKINQAILVGLHGLGGVGKTYLALDMIYNPLKNYDFRGWIRADDEDKLKADYIKLGSDHSLLRNDMLEEQKITLVKDWLNGKKNLLLVFDNVQNIEIIEKYLPQKGDIIVTSRNYKIPHAIEVDGMEEAEALELLRNLISDKICKNKCISLVKKLGYLPLAITQAGAYIEQNKITVDKYLELYNEEQSTLLLSDIMPVSDKHIPIYITWNLSLKEIMEKDKTGKAIELLNLISFSHFIDIPKSFLMEYLYGKVDKKIEIEFNQIVTFLRQYSLIKSNTNNLAIHHLLQDCIRSNINSQTQKLVLKKIIDTIKKIYPLDYKSADDYEVVKILLPHIESFLVHSREHLRPIDIVQLEICNADAYLKLGYYDNRAKILLENALEIQASFYGTRKHKEITFTLNRLGQAYLWLSDYSKAKELLEEALDIQKSYYVTNDHIEVAFTLSRLGYAYLWLGDYNKAKMLLEEALTIQKEYYGTSKHIELVFALSRLGQTYSWLGNYFKAKTLLEEALITQEEYYHTRQHIEIAYTLRRLGTAYLDTGNYNKSKEALEEALAIQTESYGSNNHIEVAFTLSRLGYSYIWSGDFDKSKTLLEEALIFQENHYGTRKHIEISFTQSRLGELYLYMGDYHKSKELLEEALHFQQSYYHILNHIDTTYIMRALGLVYLNLKNYNKSKELLNEALVVQENYYGLYHPEVACTMIALAEFYYATKNEKDALSLVERANNILQNYKSLDPEYHFIKKAISLKKKILNS